MRILALALIALSLQGCVPAILGIKEIKSGDTKITFLSGFDVGANATGTDRAHLERGVKP